MPAQQHMWHVRNKKKPYCPVAVQDELERLKAENTRLQRDNERFVRLVG
jgi:hypothetical protein